MMLATIGPPWSRWREGAPDLALSRTASTAAGWALLGEPGSADGRFPVTTSPPFPRLVLDTTLFVVPLPLISCCWQIFRC